MAKSGLGSFEGSAFYCAPKKDGSHACRKVTGRGAKDGFVKAGKGGKVVYIRAESRIAAGKNLPHKGFPSKVTEAQAACKSHVARKVAIKSGPNKGKLRSVPGSSTYRACMSKALGSSNPRQAAAQVKAGSAAKVAKAVAKAKAPAKKKKAAKKK